MKEKSLKWLSLTLTLVVSFAIINVANAPPIPLPLIYIDPAEITANPLDEFTIDINIADVVDLYSWGIKISWEVDLLRCESVTEGPFLKVQPDGTGFAATVKNNEGYIDVGCTTYGIWPGVSGSGNLMTVTFNATDAGKTELEIFYSVPLDHTLTPIPHNVEHSYFSSTAAANLVKKSAWPEHHHFVISKDEDCNGTHANQTLFGKVKNVGPVGYDLYVQVVFEIMRDNGVLASPTSEVIVLTPGATVDLSANFLVGSLDAGKHYASASVWYSYTGIYWAQGDKIKTFGFAVV